MAALSMVRRLGLHGMASHDPGTEAGRMFHGLQVFFDCACGMVHGEANCTLGFIIFGKYYNMTNSYNIFLPAANTMFWMVPQSATGASLVSTLTSTMRDVPMRRTGQHWLTPGIEQGTRMMGYRESYSLHPGGIETEAGWPEGKNRRFVSRHRHPAFARSRQSA